MEYKYDPVVIAEDLKNTLESGQELIKGAAQHYLDLHAWQKFFHNYSVETLIELGTGSGSFSLWLKKQVPNFLTYDNQQPYHDIPEFRNVDILGESEEIIKAIDYADGPFLLFCDNGNKPREVEIYSKYLKSGDYLAVHDFYIEIMPEDIPVGYELILNMGLTAFYRKEIDD